MVVICSEIVLGRALVRVCAGCNRIGLQAPVERDPRLGPGRRGLGTLRLAYPLLVGVGVRDRVRVRVRVPWPPHVAPREANPNPT